MEKKELIKKEIQYIAEDGTKFDSEYDCLYYKRHNRFVKKVKKLCYADDSYKMIKLLFSDIDHYNKEGYNAIISTRKEINSILKYIAQDCIGLGLYSSSIEIADSEWEELNIKEPTNIYIIVSYTVYEDTYDDFFYNVRTLESAKNCIKNKIKELENSLITLDKYK